MSTCKPLIIMGVDPGTRATGYALLKCEGATCTPLEFGVIRPDANALLTLRYAELFHEVSALVKNFCPDVVVVESQFVQKNIQSALKLGRAQAMVLLAATLGDIPTYEYTPTEVKQAVFHGRASKEQMRQRVKLLLNLSKEPSHDAADAIAIAICHQHRLKNPVAPTRI